MILNEDGIELSTEQVIRELLDNHTLHYVLLTAMKVYGYEESDYMADRVMKAIDGVM